MLGGILKNASVRTLKNANDGLTKMKILQGKVKNDNLIKMKSMYPGDGCVVRRRWR